MRWYAAAVTVTAAVAVLALAGAPLGGPVALALLAASVLTTGMPHGAVDHLVARQLFGLGGARGAALFYGGYLALAALYGLFWWTAPQGALALFLFLAAYHFGQADLVHLAPGHPAWRCMLYLSRGAFVVGAPLLSDPGAVAPVVEALGGEGFLALAVYAEGVFSVAALAGQHALLLAGEALREWATQRSSGRGEAATWLGRELFSTAVLALLFGAAPPLAAFAVYFGLWHALGHILVLLRFFRHALPEEGLRGSSGAKGAAGPRTARRFYRQAALYTLLPVGALLLYVFLTAPGSADSHAPLAGELAALFVLISVLTLPHMLLVEGLYRHERRRFAQAGTPPREGSP